MKRRFPFGYNLTLFTVFFICMRFFIEGSKNNLLGSFGKTLYLNGFLISSLLRINVFQWLYFNVIYIHIYRVQKSNFFWVIFLLYIVKLFYFSIEVFYFFWQFFLTIHFFHYFTNLISFIFESLLNSNSTLF